VRIPADFMPDRNSAGIIAVTSALQGAGKTHVACALARWLANQGYHPVPLHLSRSASSRVDCPGGGTISRPAALLAEACRVPPEPLLESSWASLAELAARGDVVIVEAPWQEAQSSGLPLIQVEQTPTGVLVNGFPLPVFAPALTGEDAPELEGLPPWEYASRPRTGVISLPHLLDFRDLALLRGAEWLTAAGIGQFEFVFVPATANAPHDAAWLEETGLLPWLEEQARGGAVVVSCGWEVGGARVVEREDLTDARRLSMLLGRRVAPPLPDDAVFDEMAEWAAPWARQESLLEALL
jgi:cobyric acid synthase